MNWFRHISLLSLAVIGFGPGAAIATEQKIIQLLDRANKKVNQGAAAACAPVENRVSARTLNDGNQALCEGLEESEKFKYADQFDLNIECPRVGNVSLSLSGHWPKDGAGKLFTGTSNPSAAWSDFAKSDQYKSWKEQDADLNKRLLWVGKAQEQWLSSMSVNLSLKKLFEPFPATGPKTAKVAPADAQNLVNWHNEHASDRGLGQMKLVSCSSDHYVVTVTPKCTMNFSDEADRNRYIALMKAMYEYQESVVPGVQRLPVAADPAPVTPAPTNPPETSPGQPAKPEESRWVPDQRLTVLLTGPKVPLERNVLEMFHDRASREPTDMTTLELSDYSKVKVISLNSAANGLQKVMTHSKIEENQILSYFTVEVKGVEGTEKLLDWAKNLIQVPQGVEVKLVPYSGGENQNRKNFVAVVFKKNS